MRENGYFQPKGRCESSLAWAQLLFALNIRPEGGVLAWRLPPRDIDPAISSEISLEVDGDVMCHIINLYRLYNNPAPRDFSNDDLGQCRFHFGRLSLGPWADKFAATFEPRTNDDLSSQRVPFSYSASHLIGTHLRFDREALVARYFNAIYHQISDTAAIGDLPNPEDPMKKRAKYFIRSLKYLQSDHVCVDSCEQQCSWLGQNVWGRPKLVTWPWVEEASRIKRRVTTNGGEDMGLVDYIMASLHNQPEFASKAKRFVEALYYTSDWESRVRGQLKGRCMFTDEHVTIYWSGRKLSLSRGAHLWNLVMCELPSIIESLAERPIGTWLHELSSMVPEILELLSLDDSLLNVPVVVLS